MPNKENAVYYAIALVIVGLMIGAFLYSTRGGHVELKGDVLKVRTMASDENNSIAIVDFRFVNPSDYSFMVRSVTVFVVNPDGSEQEGLTISEVDARRLFEYYKELGPKYNESLVMKSKVAPKQSMDRMIAASFPMKVAKLDARKHIRLRVEEVDGPVSEILETRK